MMKLCAYCEKNEASSSEHVFPHGLGGAKTFLDCVCEECNTAFSKLETELMQNAPTSIMRSVEGIKGYSKSFHKTPLKNAIVLIEDEKTGIPFECGQKFQFEPFLRSQIILIDGEFYIESGDDREYKYFTKRTSDWMRDVLVAVTGRDDYGIFHGVRFDTVGAIVDRQTKIDKLKNEIRIETLSPTHAQFEKYVPRLFLDDSKSLILRVRSKEEALEFLTLILKNKGNKLYSFSPTLTDEVSVNQNFDPAKTDRALVKIGLNCLMYYYPETSFSEALGPLKSFVLRGGQIKTETLSGGLKSIDESFKEFHTVGFFQQPKGILIRIGLFGGSFSFSFGVLGLSIMKNEMFTLMKVDYQNRRNEFLKFEEVLNHIAANR